MTVIPLSEAIISSRSPSPSNSYFFSMDTCQTRSGCISSRRAMLLYYMKYVQYAQHPRSPHLSGRETPSSSLGRRGAIYVNALSSSFLPSFVRSFVLHALLHSQSRIIFEPYMEKLSKPALFRSPIGNWYGGKEDTSNGHTLRITQDKLVAW